MACSEPGSGESNLLEWSVRFRVSGFFELRHAIRFVRRQSKTLAQYLPRPLLQENKSLGSWWEQGTACMQVQGRQSVGSEDAHSRQLDCSCIEFPVSRVAMDPSTRANCIYIYIYIHMCTYIYSFFAASCAATRL